MIRYAPTDVRCQALYLEDHRSRTPGSRVPLQSIGGSLRQCSSGKDLIEWGFATDVMLAAQLNVSGCAPLLVNDASRQAKV
jgi:hypothetical protein